jgi:hypothetical protein
MCYNLSYRSEYAHSYEINPLFLYELKLFREYGQRTSDTQKLIIWKRWESVTYSRGHTLLDAINVYEHNSKGLSNYDDDARYLRFSGTQVSHG